MSQEVHYLDGYYRLDLHTFIADASTYFASVYEGVRIAAIVAFTLLLCQRNLTLLLQLNLKERMLPVLYYLAWDYGYLVIYQQQSKADYQV